MNTYFLLTMLSAVLVSIQSPPPVPAREAATATVIKIQRADYAGDRAALQRLLDELAPYKDDKLVGTRVLYWQAFALWRRSINGVNESIDPRELEQDTQRAIAIFEEAVRRDPGFVDAKIGIASCLQMVAFFNRENPARMQEIIPRFATVLKESLAAAPENPRLLWLYGSSLWWTPPGTPQPQVDERHAAGLAAYEKGLAFARKQKGTIADPLEPAWGEPELLMNLAWSRLNGTPSDPAAAEALAREALSLVPHWHYVKDILMPQIQTAKTKEK